MILQTPEPEKLARSGAIVLVALISLLAVKYVFPSFDWVQIETAMLALFGAWLVNIVKEATGL